MSDDAKSASGTGLTFPQIAASALAAATAAILGSFMGVFGTIGGAAAASIVSTVGSALYQKSLERTRDRVKERLVVSPTQQKVAGAVARVTGKQDALGGAAAPTQARPGYQARPPQQSGQPYPQRPDLGLPPTQVSQQAPPVQRPGVAGPGRAPAGPGGRGPAPGSLRPDGRPGTPGPPGRPVRGGGRTVATSVQQQPPYPNAGIPDARGTGTPPGGVPPTARFAQGPGETRGPAGDGDAVTQVVADRSPRRRRIGKKGWLAMAGLAVSIFAIGLFASFAVETATGHPLSGGSSGTSVGSLFGQNTGTAAPTTSESPTTSERSDSDSDSSTSDRKSHSNDSGRSGSSDSSSEPRTTTRAPSGNGGNDQGGSSSQRGGVGGLLPQLGVGAASNG